MLISQLRAPGAAAVQYAVQYEVAENFSGQDYASFRTLGQGLSPLQETLNGDPRRPTAG